MSRFKKQVVAKERKCSQDVFKMICIQNYMYNIWGERHSNFDYKSGLIYLLKSLDINCLKHSNINHTLGLPYMFPIQNSKANVIT